MLLSLLLLACEKSRMHRKAKESGIRMKYVKESNQEQMQAKSWNKGLYRASRSWM